MPRCQTFRCKASPRTANESEEEVSVKVTAARLIFQALNLTGLQIKSTQASQRAVISAGSGYQRQAIDVLEEKTLSSVVIRDKMIRVRSRVAGKVFAIIEIPTIERWTIN